MSILCACAAHGGAGTWKNFTSMKDVKGIARSGHNYWAATSGGLFRWNEQDGSYLTLTNAEGLQSVDLTAVGIDGKGDIWAGASTGMLHAYTPSTGSVRIVPDIATLQGQTDKRINAFSIQGDTLLICTDFGLSVYKIGEGEFGDTYSKFGSIPATSLLHAYGATISRGRLWVAISDGATNNFIASANLSLPNILEPQAWVLQAVGPPGAVPSAVTSSGGRVFAGTSSGLYYNADTGWTAVTSMSGKSIVALSASPGSLDICTAANEVFTLDSSITLHPYGGILPYTPTSVITGSSGAPVVGSLAGGILLYGTQWVSHLPNGPNSNQFVSVAVTPDGTVWGASGGQWNEGNGRGFYRYNGHDWKSFTPGNSALPPDPKGGEGAVYRLSVGCNGSLWAATYGRGIVEVPSGSDVVDSAHIFGTGVGMVGVANDHTYVVPGTVACDSRGNTWTSIRLPANLNVLAVQKPDGSWQNLPLILQGTRITDLIDLTIDHSLAVDAADNLWGIIYDIGARGIFTLYNSGAIDSVVALRLTSSDGLPSNNVTTLVIDSDNNIWVGTDHGIAIILDPSNPTRPGGMASYKPLNGLVINAIAIDPLNQKWVATSEGVILLSADGTQELTSYTVETTQGKLIDNNVLSIGIDPGSGTVYFGTAFGLASLSTPAIAPKASFDKFLIYPNPYKVPNTIPLSVDGLVANSNLKILTIDGILVRDINTPGGRIGYWDGTDTRGNTVASGIYIVVGYTADGSQTGKGKVAVIRR